MADQDAPWKEALDRYFEPFMALFFPPAHSEIDWTRGYEMLDKEFQQTVREGETGRRLVDRAPMCSQWSFWPTGAQQTTGDDEPRRAHKIRLIRRPYERGLTPEDVRDLYRLIDWYSHRRVRHARRSRARA